MSKTETKKINGHATNAGNTEINLEHGGREKLCTSLQNSLISKVKQIAQFLGHYKCCLSYV